METKYVLETCIAKEINESKSTKEKESVKEEEKEKEKENENENEKENEKEKEKESEKEKENEKENENENENENESEASKEKESESETTKEKEKKGKKRGPVMCFQIAIIVSLLIIYTTLYNNNIYDFIIYFCFGLSISVMFIASLVLIKKFHLVSSKKFILKNYTKFILSFIKDNLCISEDNACMCTGVLDIVLHMLFSIIALIYIKSYIKNSKKTKNAALISFILFCIWGLINIYVNDAIELYNKVLKTTKTESTTVIISITLTYSGLIYYFDTLKNQKNDFINKLIN